jgi:sterol desaturase/sphingolipid hydroxylase (fatty acid hydroxylase superfamily)
MGAEMRGSDATSGSLFSYVDLEDRVIATPRGHHWHHALEPIDVNFAVHLPVLDRFFGTQHLPADRWPAEYGIGGHPVPEGWTAQLVYPVRRRRH